MKKTHRATQLSIALSATLAAGALALSPAVALAEGATSNGILVTMSAPAAGEVSLLADAASALGAAGVEVTEVVSAGDGEATVLAKPAEGQSDEQALAAAQATPGVTRAQLNYVYELIEPVEEDAAPAGARLGSGGVVPLATAPVSDPFAQVSDPEQSPNQYWLYDTGLVGAWDALPAAQGEPVVIVTLDSGADLGHEDLADNLIAEHAYDTANDRPLSENTTTDAAGHGTAIAGIAAAVANNGMGIAGSTRNAAELLPVKVIYDSGNLTGQADSASLLAAYEYVFDLIESGALENVRVFNLSLGAYGDDFDEDGALHDAITLAREHYGILSVCAGGNGDAKEPYTDPIYPGDYEECVSVTALEPDGSNIHWSDYNQYKDISAPGRSIWTTYTRLSSIANGYYSGGLSGTSLSAPMVSGAAAILFAANPDATVDDVIEALYATAAPIEDAKDDRTSTSGTHGALAADEAAEHLAWHVKNPLSFADVTSESWFYDPVTYVVANAIMSGYADGSGSFGAADEVQRQDVALILYRYLGNGETAPSCGLVDVLDDYYTTAVNWCVANGYFTGYQDGSNEFGVGDKLSRQDFVTVIYRIAQGEKDPVDGGAFDKMPDSSQTMPWAVNAAKWALDKGVITGKEQPDGSLLLEPLSSISRAEVATIMQRVIEQSLL